MDIDLTQPQTIDTDIEQVVRTISIETNSLNYSHGFKIFHYAKGDNDPLTIYYWYHNHVPGERGYTETPLTVSEYIEVLTWLRKKKIYV